MRSFYVPHARVTLYTGDTLVTKQSHKDECDIHRILKQYRRTGIITHVQSARPTYGDLPDVQDYQTSMNTIIEAQDAFSALPAAVRDHWKNDPALFLAAFSDDKQRDKLVEFGFIKPSPADQAEREASSPPDASAGA